MVRVWYKLITKTEHTIEDVPPELKDAVLEMLHKNGYDQNGSKL